MQERRKHLRQRSLLGGVIAVPRRSAVVDCLVRDISPDGAKLVLSNAAAAPDEFDLTLTQKQRCYRVRAIWRTPDAIGVEFLKQHVQPTPTPLDWARRLHACETENTQLRKRLADVTRSW